MPTTARLDIAQARLEEALGGPRGLVTNYVLRITDKIRDRAVLYCPVDTGTLRSSITTAVRPAGLVVTGTVGTPVEYAVPVHEGVKAGPVTVKAHTVKAHTIKAHKVKAHVVKAYTVPARNGRKAYTVPAHTVKAHTVYARTQLGTTVPEHTRMQAGRAGRPFLRRAMHDTLGVGA